MTESRNAGWLVFAAVWVGSLIGSPCLVQAVASAAEIAVPGGTCPSAAVAVACAAYLYAVWPDTPQPDAIIRLLRETSTIDRTVLVSEGAFPDDAIDRLEHQIVELRNPPDGRQRKLDAPGVLNLYRAYQRLEARASREDS